MYEIYKETHFAAVHYLTNYKGKCENIHGHNWKVRVYVRGEELNDLDLLIDFRELKDIIDNIADILDHAELNEIQPFNEINPSAENIAKWFYDRTSEEIDDERIEVSKVMVWETERSCAIYKKEDNR